MNLIIKIYMLLSCSPFLSSFTQSHYLPLCRDQPNSIQSKGHRIDEPVEQHRNESEKDIPKNTPSKNRLRQLRPRNFRRHGRLEGAEQPVERDERCAEAIDHKDPQPMLTIQFQQPRCAAKVSSQCAHVCAMIHAILDARAFGSKKMVVRRVCRHLHFPGDESCPPHGLLLGNWGDSPDTWTDEADEGDVLVGGVDDVSNLGIGCCGICPVEVRECLLVAITALASAKYIQLIYRKRLTRYSIPHSLA